ncbi:MAG: YegP family protein [Candidatus Thiodiazotropha sp. (ex Notomyrtea botanica)]|nr:YegP family protein [Candidatus Thiodiazotropha sp. (ex Notomyrtea botanica)]
MCFQVIETSKSYESVSARADDGIESVKKNGPGATVANLTT